MNTGISIKRGVVLFAAALLAACAGTPQPDPRVQRLETAYQILAEDPRLAPYGGQELVTARSALLKVKNPPREWDERDFALALYSTDRLINLAGYEARARYADAQRKELADEREALVLQARTREAKRARAEAEQAQRQAAIALATKEQALREASEALSEAERARMTAEAERARANEARQEAAAAAARAEEARTAAERAEAERTAAEARRAAAEADRLAAEAEAEAARMAAREAEAEKSRLKSRLAELEARETERGLVVTLGDVLFEFNKAQLIDGAARNLDPLVKVLREWPDQSVVIEGHTDSVGTRDYNLALSERRAAAVADYLIRRGIEPERIVTHGLGPDHPVASNDSPTGRQLNRRVEIILPDADTIASSR